MNNIDLMYQELLSDIINNGTNKMDRTNVGTKSVFSREIRHDMKSGFPLLTTKKMYWKGIVTELLWFLRGDTNIKWLVDNNCNIWVGDSYKNYCKHASANSSEYNMWMRDNGDGTLSMYTEEEFIQKIKNDDDFAKKWGDLGPIYGKQWTKWTKFHYDDYDEKRGFTTDIECNIECNIEYINQIKNVINTLKTNPDDRRMIVNAYNVGDLDDMVLPPCHLLFQFWTRELSSDERLKIWEEKYPDNAFMVPYNESPHSVLDNDNIPSRGISLKFNMRSTDVGLGLGFNLASYGLLLLIIAKEVGMIPDELIFSGGDVHLYLNHIDLIKEQLNRTPFELPTVQLKDVNINDISEYNIDDIILKNYKCHPKIKLPLSN